MQSVSPFMEISNEDIIGRRIQIENSIGSIKFSGNLTHQGRPAGSQSQRWLGIEWDDLTRGKHNGTVQDVTYFTTLNNSNSGTLIKFEKADFGIEVLEGIFKKYFQEVPEGFKEKYTEALLKLESTEEQQNLNPNNNQKTETKPTEQVKHQKPEQKPEQIGVLTNVTSETVANNTNESKPTNNQSQTSPDQKGTQEVKTHDDGSTLQMVSVSNGRKMVSVETDQEAVFGTKKQNRKIVQFYGFDKIWEKLNNMETLREISLVRTSISNVGIPGYFSNLLPNLRTLSLEANLLFDWNQVYLIGHELPLLESLSLINNKLQQPVKVKTLEKIIVNANNSELNVKPCGVFKNLQNLSLNDMRLNWRQICDVIPAFPVLEDLILCKNTLVDYENIDFDEKTQLQNLKFLNLEITDIDDFSGLLRFGLLPNLQVLILNRNKLMKFGTVKGFDKLTHLSLEGNLIMDAKVLSEIGQFQELTYLNIQHNPVQDQYSKDYVRQRCVAENAQITVINGSDLYQYERQDCEIYYMRKSFDEFFEKFGMKYYDYDFDQFVQWAADQHPIVAGLMQKYGNPYQVHKQEQQSDVSAQQTVVRKKMIQVIVNIAGGPLLGNPPVQKQFPETTTIGNLKNVFSTLMKIPSDQQVIKYQVNKHDPMVVFQEDHKPLFFYGIMDDTEIFVESQNDNK